MFMAAELHDPSCPECEANRLVCREEEPRLREGALILPIAEFLARLWAGEIV